MNSKKVLLVEGSNFFGRSVKHQLETTLGLQVIWFRDEKEITEIILDYSAIDLALIDYGFLSPNGSKILEVTSKHNIPIVIFTNEINSDLQEKIWSYKVIDYIFKGTNHSVHSAVEITSNFFLNSSIEILIVDNYKESREHLKKILSVHRYKILEAESTEEALEKLELNEKIRLVITDYHSTDLDGLKLTSEIRSKYPLDRLAIIGVSAQGNHALKIRFIKSGANDFINKPFVSELLYCRVSQNLKIVEYFHKLKDMALVDQLTGLNNRHFLRDTGNLILENSKRNGSYIVTAMIDIDDFKNINDLYSHEAGDAVLKHIGRVLKDSVRKSDLLCRYGGEEFVIIANNLNPKNAVTFFDKLRLKIANSPITISNKRINVTISVGVCIEKGKNLDEIINEADIKMYEAKSSGKNRVCI